MTLFTTGCSFTYGEELPDPATQCWPALLAKRLDMPLANWSRPGAGNDYLIKKTMQYVPRLKPSLVIVSWTGAGRVEFSDDNGIFNIWPGLAPTYVAYPPHEHRGEVLEYITRHNNDLHEHRRWLRNVVLLQDYLKLRNVNYFFLNNFDNQARNRQFNLRCRDYVNQIDTSRFIGWPDEGTLEWTAHLPKMPRMHPGPEAHTEIAAQVYRFIDQSGNLPVVET